MRDLARVTGDRKYEVRPTKWISCIQNET